MYMSHVFEISNKVSLNKVMRCVKKTGFVDK